MYDTICKYFYVLLIFFVPAAPILISTGVSNLAAAAVFACVINPANLTVATEPLNKQRVGATVD